MRTTSLEQFVRLRRELTQERETLQNRLRDINEALGEMPLPSLSAAQGAAGQSARGKLGRGRGGRRAAGGGGGGGSLREHVIAVLQGGPKTKEEVLSAVQNRGYRFSTNNPLNSLGVILYGRNPKFNREGGQFSLGRGAGTAARSKGAAASGGGKPKRRMSPAARKAIADAARRRWAAAKAAGKKRL